MADFSTLKNRFRGKSIFSLSIGPSLNTIPLDKLQNKFTCGMKLIPTYFVPTLWVCLEEWTEMPASIWEHPKLIKLIPHQIQDKGYLKPQPPKFDFFHSVPLQKVPNLYVFQLNEEFKTDTFLSEQSVSWGCDKKIVDEFGIRGRRSIFLALFKIYYYLGFRKIYLCGVDFKMNVKQPYCYSRKKAEGAVQENNLLYESLSTRLQGLLPKFKEAGLEVYNCNKNSNLTVFPFKEFEECLQESESV